MTAAPNVMRSITPTIRRREKAGPRLLNLSEHGSAFWSLVTSFLNPRMQSGFTTKPPKCKRNLLSMHQSDWRNLLYSMLLSGDLAEKHFVMFWSLLDGEQRTRFLLFFTWKWYERSTWKWSIETSTSYAQQSKRASSSTRMLNYSKSFVQWWISFNTCFLVNIMHYRAIYWAIHSHN